MRGEIRRHTIKEKERRKATIEQRYIPVAERSIMAIPTQPPVREKIAIMGRLTNPISKTKRITEDISIMCPKQMQYLITNVKIDEDNKFQEAITSGEELTIVSDGGLKIVRGFGWVIALDKEIIATCQGSVKGSKDPMSSFRNEAVGMASAMYFLKKITEELHIKLRANFWTDNTSLVRRIKLIREQNPIGAHIRNDHDAYNIIRDSSQNVMINEVGHVRTPGLHGQRLESNRKVEHDR